jgi:hypothetical protein
MPAPKTPMQVAAAIKVKEKMEKGEKIEMGPIMREVGYSVSSSEQPGTALLNTEGWQELMEGMLPDIKLVKANAEALEANKIISARVTSKEADVDTDDFIEVPDHPTRLKAVELGYKLKGKMGDINVGGGVHFHQHVENQKKKYGI